MEFSAWLQEEYNQDKPIFYFQNGLVTMYLRGQKYVYSTSSDQCRCWKKQSKSLRHQHRPFELLNQIKNYVEKGWAEQLFPPPKPEPAQKQSQLF